MTATIHVIRLFVYGTLKRGQANQARFCANATDIAPPPGGAATPWTSGSPPWKSRLTASWHKGPTILWPMRAPRLSGPRSGLSDRQGTGT